MSHIVTITCRSGMPMLSGLPVIGFLWPNLSRARSSFSVVKLKAWPCNCRTGSIPWS